MDFLNRLVPPASARSLGILRVLFFGFLLLRYADHNFAVWTDAPEMFWAPHGSFLLLKVEQPGSNLPVLSICFKISILLSCLGLFTRVSTVACAVLGTYLFGIDSCFEGMSHELAVPALALIVLACSRCGDAFSLDSKRLSAQIPEPDFAYAWPPFYIQILLCNMLFWAGVSKLNGDGPSWGAGPEFECLMKDASVRWSDGVPLQGGLWILEHAPWVLAFLGPMTLLVELLMPLALLPRFRFFGALGFGLLLGIRVVLGPNFITASGLIIFWVPWDKWLSVKSRGSSEESLQ